MYVFLDVDGVLNKQSDWTRPFTLNDECVFWFNRLLIEVPNVKLVLSSTWRNGISRDGSKAEPIEDLMAKLSGIDDLDRTATSPDGFRDKEIDYYLRRHTPDDYIILDDDVSLFSKGKKTEKLYVIDCVQGFTKSDYEKLKKLVR